MARTKTKPVGRTPAKRRACEEWLEKQLATGPSLAREILASGVASKWGWATVRRAKASVGVQSFRKNEEWWWFDPRRFDPQKDSSPQKLVQSEPYISSLTDIPKQREAASSVALVHSEQSHLAPIAFSPLLLLAPSPEKPAQQNLQIPSKQTRPTPLPSEKTSIPVTPSSAPEPASPKSASPPKKRPFHIWDSAVTENRDAMIAAAGFADLYTMRLDIRFRQEHLRARGLFKEEAALNELLARVNDALEKKKKAANLE
jgi:hypothetical protein